MLSKMAISATAVCLLMPSADLELPCIAVGRMRMWAKFTWKITVTKALSDCIMTNQDETGTRDVFGKNEWSLSGPLAPGNCKQFGGARK